MIDDMRPATLIGCLSALVMLACGSSSDDSGSNRNATQRDGGTGGTSSGSGGTAGSGASGAGTGGAVAGGAANASGGSSPGGGGSASGGAAGAPGTGGTASCPPECFVNNRCVAKCGDAPQDYGCCPCPDGMVNVFSCSTVDAGGNGGAGGGSGKTSCDTTKVLCKIATPMCPSGQVVSVNGVCYGPCVPIEQCSCTKASDCPDSNQYTCHMNTQACGPYVN
jgi:hypothetical protein